MDNFDGDEEDSLSSDEEYDEFDEDSGTSTDVDAKLAEDDVFDIEFFKCYSALKKKDGKIYDREVKFFSKEESDSEDECENERAKNFREVNMKTSGTKMTLLDHELGLKEGEIEEPSKVGLNPPVSKSFYEKELDEIKKSIEKISENVESESDDDLLIVKKSEGSESKPKPRTKIDEMLDKLEQDDAQDINHLKQLWSNPDNLTEEERYLRDYILNKRYLPGNSLSSEEGEEQEGFFSKNLDELSDIEEDDKESKVKTKRKADRHSDEKNFEKIARVPRNSTKTIRDLTEKRGKKEKRMKKVESLKKKKKILKDADFEDIVGGLTTRFHYSETEPNDYGLSSQELLMATDEELDKWASLKQTISHKTREEELAVKSHYDKKRNDLELKRKIFKSIYEEDDKVETSESKKTEKIRLGVEDEGFKSHEKAHVEGTAKQLSKRSKKRKRGLNHKKFAKSGVAPDRLLAYGISKSKLKKSKLL